MSMIDIILKYHKAFANGLFITLKLCLVIWSFGIVFGSLLGIAGNRWSKWIGIPAQLGSFVLSGIPVLVFLFWMHYPLQEILNVVIDPFYTAVATFTIINIFSVGDLVRKALNDFPAQYITAAKVCGLSTAQTIRYIQFPIILRRIIPGLLITQVNMLQISLFASLISVNEIFREAQRINAMEYKPVEIYSALGLFFLMVCLPLNGLALWLKKKFTRDLSEK